MKRLLPLILALLLLGLPGVTANAAEVPEFRFELTVDGSDTRQVKTGDIITVVLRLKRADALDKYTMYAMQDEIRYDSDFFELVEKSQVLGKNVVSTDVAMRDNYREFYMNYLSASGGTSWEADTLVGSFQLEVIATSGVTKITNQDHLVSAQDGMESYISTANELTIMLSTECAVHFESNGGSPVDNQTAQYGEKLTKPEDPKRDGYTFDAWYKDLDRTEKWDFDTDTVSGNMTLFAGWAVKTDVPAPGDSTAPIVWALLALLTLALLVFLLLPRKTVRFETAGGSEVKSKHVLKNCRLKAPENPHKYRSVFDGWYRDEQYTTLWDFENDVIVDNTTLYAKWM